MKRSHLPFIYGIAILAPLLALIILTPWLRKTDPYESNVEYGLVPPLTQAANGILYYFGSDSLGRDIFSRVIYGARISFMLAGSAVIMAFIIGTSVGMASVFSNKLVEWIILRLIDIQLAIPFIILALAIATTFEPSLLMLISILTTVSWVNFSKISRGVTLQEVNKDYVKAAQIVGCSKFKIALRYVFPNVLPNILPLLILQFASLIMFEATLGYLGVSLRPPTPTLGRMMLEGQPYMRYAWWWILAPGSILFFVTLGLNLIGEGLRQATDPRSLR